MSIFDKLTDGNKAKILAFDELLNREETKEIIGWLEDAAKQGILNSKNDESDIRMAHQFRAMFSLTESLATLREQKMQELHELQEQSSVESIARVN